MFVGLPEFFLKPLLAAVTQELNVSPGRIVSWFQLVIRVNNDNRPERH
jgi:hypothetical protein